MKKFANAFLFCFVVFVLPSCEKDNPVDTSPSVKQIWPLKPGNTWAFSTVEYDTTGTVIKSGFGSFVVTTDTIVSGETWYHITGTGSGGTMFYTNRSEGLWVMSNSTSGLFQGLFFKYPVNAGDNWSLGGDPMFLQSADTVITVPAGTFHCYEYRLSMIDYYYFCPGVGIISEDSYSSTNSGRRYLKERLSITSFTLK
ncbi:MAG: hypothetical protein WDA22_03840 [Bacteroidota bacterium]